MLLHKLTCYSRAQKRVLCPWISFSKQAVLWEQRRAGEEQTDNWTNSKGMQSPFHPFSPSFQSHGNGAFVSSVLFLHPEGLEWVPHNSGLALSSTFLPTRDLTTVIKKREKGTGFFKFIFFLIAESITLSFIPVSKSSAFYVGSVGINLKVLVRSTGRHSCKSTRTCKSPQRAVRAWLSVVKCKIFYFFFLFPNVQKLFVVTQDSRQLFKISIFHVLVVCSRCAAIWWWPRLPCLLSVLLNCRFVGKEVKSLNCNDCIQGVAPFHPPGTLAKA